MCMNDLSMVTMAQRYSGEEPTTSRSRVQRPSHRMRMTTRQKVEVHEVKFSNLHGFRGVSVVRHTVQRQHHARGDRN